MNQRRPCVQRLASGKEYAGSLCLSLLPVSTASTVLGNSIERASLFFAILRDEHIFFPYCSFPRIEADTRLKRYYLLSDFFPQTAHLRIYRIHKHYLPN